MDADRRPLTGGELLVRALAAAGVEVVFGLPGVHNLPAWRAFERSGVRLVTVRHEQAAAYAADGYARASGRLGVALTTTGPGAANTLAAVGEAWAAGTPMLVIATDIPTTLRRPGVYRGVLHEVTDQAAMFRPVTKARVRVGAAEEIEAAVARAAADAQVAPSRPVYVEVPTDLLRAEAAPAADRAGEVPAAPLAPPGAELERALSLLAEAERPLVWAGGGALRAGAGAQVEALAEALGAPVLTTYLARGLIVPEHPCAVGLPPHVPEAGALWDEADLVVAVGTDFDGMTTQNWAQPQPPRMIAINVDADDAQKNYRADLVLAADARAALDALLPLLVPRDEDAVGGLAERLERIRAAAWGALRAEHRGGVEFLERVGRALPAEATVVCDMCIPGYWLGALLPVAAPRRLLYPMGWGTLGFGFPAGLGAALAPAAGGGPVVSFSGDGGFLFACGELATAAAEGIPLTAVVVDDGGYGMLRHDDPGAAGPRPGIDLEPTPDFAALAGAFGVRAEAVDGLGSAFEDALRRHVAEPEPSLLAARASLDPPPTTSPRWYRRRAQGTATRP